MSRQRKWDLRFLELAETVSHWSKDPSTKCGSVIVRPDLTIASIGFNGFARGMNDHAERYANRETKYSRIIHAEMNAVLSAAEPVKGYTMYVHPLFPCDRCMPHLIQAGLDRFVSPVLTPELANRWGLSLTRAIAYAEEANKSWELIEQEEDIVTDLFNWEPSEPRDTEAREAT